MSYAALKECLDPATVRARLRARVAAAVAARLYPTGPHPKELAEAIGVSVQTIYNLRAGNHDCAAWIIGQLCAFFGITFWHDVYGELGAQMQARHAARVAADQAAHAREAAALAQLTRKGA